MIILQPFYGLHLSKKHTNNKITLQHDSINQVIRKVRAQTLLDGMARELTPYIAKALSVLNPDKNEILPSEEMRTFGSLAIGTNLNNFIISTTEHWGFNLSVRSLLLKS